MYAIKILRSDMPIAECLIYVDGKYHSELYGLKDTHPHLSIDSTYEHAISTINYVASSRIFTDDAIFTIVPHFGGSDRLLNSISEMLTL